MKHDAYDEREALAMLPLLGAITGEIMERTGALEMLDIEVEALRSMTPHNEESLRHVAAEAATHRRELRHAKRELEQLGCSVVGTEPLTLRIPGKVGEARHSFVWQAGDPVLK
jgi:hypothetical protein